MYQKVNNHVFICALKFYFSGSFEILNFSGEAPKKDQRFFETIHKGVYDATNPYFSKGSFSFNENSRETESGTLYQQQASFRFPSNDPLRSERIDKLRRVKYLEMIMNDGTSFIMGNNDISQNRAPKVETGSNFHLTEVKMSTESIMPVMPVFVSVPGGPDPLLGYDYTYNFELS